MFYNSFFCNIFILFLFFLFQMSTFIYYFIPEDNEKEDNMNVFIIYKDYKDVKIYDIKENFPLPGQYYFRFKFDYNGKSVYIDFNNPKNDLPKYNDKIIMKVQRINWDIPEQSNNINVFSQFK